MFSARWQIDAKFGHKQTVLELLKNENARSARRSVSTISSSRS